MFVPAKVQQKNKSNRKLLQVIVRVNFYRDKKKKTLFNSSKTSLLLVQYTATCTETHSFIYVCDFWLTIS